MTISLQIAKHLRDIHFGGNWTSVNLKEQVTGINWQQATTKIYNLNSIAQLLYHINYYVAAQLKVLQGKPLDAHDTFSFYCPPIQSQNDWDKLCNKAFEDANNLANLIEVLPDEQLWQNFEQEKYGNYYRNLHGMIEHCHYHLGQISLIKKIILQQV